MLASLQLSGAVVGALLNDPAQIAALGVAAHQAPHRAPHQPPHQPPRQPHKAPPQAPVLEVEPRHTLAGEGARVQVPAGMHALEIGCSLGVVNGQVTQQGHTADMIKDIPALIEYLSEFMTLQPGDVILTGTLDGVVKVKAGDVVECEIDGIGCLHNTLVGDADFGL